MRLTHFHASLIFTCLILITSWDGPQTTPVAEAFAFFADEQPLYSFDCYRLADQVDMDEKFQKLLPDSKAPEDDWLGEGCNIIKVYNETQIESMDELKLINITKACACKLAFADILWERSFDSEPARRLYDIVVDTLKDYRNGSRQNVNRHPDYLWSDIDVTIYKISIYTSTKDYFDKAASDPSFLPSAKLLKEFNKRSVWRAIRSVCFTLTKDPFKLYQYLENLNRASSTIFARLVELSEPIEQIYQASKACKMLLGHSLRSFKLRPDNSEFVVVDQRPSLEHDSFDYQNLISGDLDRNLQDASGLLLKCKTWQRRRSSYDELARQCPMMVSATVPAEWIQEHQSYLDRTQVAVKCGCQLLLHNATWATLMNDPSIQIMSTALTNFMNQRGVPDFVNTPIWSIYGWFEDIIREFKGNRERAIKEVVKTMIGDQDPLRPINRSTNDRSKALELIRKGCNYIVFNYNKDARQAIELKLIKYLDNLQLISQDSLFVFHLTLQDTNLFKLHALSKMCSPFLK